MTFPPACPKVPALPRPKFMTLLPRPILFALALAATAGSAGLAAEPELPPADALGSLHRLQPGDTPESIAAAALGTPDAAAELLRFNRMTRGQFAAATNGVAVAVPGPLRGAALDRLEAANAALEAAKAAQAERFAARTFADAVETLHLALQAREEAAYDQAAALAHLARLRLERSLAESDEKAPAAVAGFAEGSAGKPRITPARSAETLPLGAETAIPPGARVETDAAARIRLRWADRVTLQQEDGTALRVEAAVTDRRDNRHNYLFTLEQGAVEIRAHANGPTTTRVMVDDLGVEFSEGAHVRVARRADGVREVSVWEGKAHAGKRSLGAGDGWMEGPKLKGIEFRLPAGAGAAPARVTAAQRPELALPPRAAGEETVVEILRDERGLDLVSRGVGTGAVFQPDLLAPGVHFWRAAGRKTGGGPLGPWTPPARLEIRQQLGIRLAVSPAPLRKDGQEWVSGLHTFTPVPADGETSAAAFEFARGDETFTRVDGPILLTRPGKTRLRVRAMAADGTAGPEVVAEYRVDTDAPVLKFSNVAGGDGSQEIELGAKDESGIAALEFRFNEKDDFSPYTAPIRVDPRKTPTLHFRATDGVGNVSRSRQVDLTQFQ